MIVQLHGSLAWINPEHLHTEWKYIYISMYSAQVIYMYIMAINRDYMYMYVMK